MEQTIKQEAELEGGEIKMFRVSLGASRMDGVRTEHIRGLVDGEDYQQEDSEVGSGKGEIYGWSKNGDQVSWRERREPSQTGSDGGR